MPAQPHHADAAAAYAAGLTYACDSTPGFVRLRVGEVFDYFDGAGMPVRDPATLARIRKLAIPPAYEQVWICADADGHLQATGRDARGRKQYRYHAHWREARDHGKFQRMIEFGAALPRLRRQLARDLALPGLPRAKVLALVASLLDQTRSRVGNAEYQRANGSYGLTTLRDRHVEFLDSGRAFLRYRGKSGQMQEIAIDDLHLASIVRHCQQLPGQALFQFVDDAGRRQPVDSTQVNDYLGAAMGEAFTAKDFRTFGGTLRAVQLMARTPLPERASQRACAGCINHAIREVARELGNTPAVARKSYIHPLVFAQWRSGELPKRAPRRRGLTAAESLTVEFLRRAHAADDDLESLLRASRRTPRRSAARKLPARRRRRVGAKRTATPR